MLPTIPTMHRSSTPFSSAAAGWRAPPSAGCPPPTCARTAWSKRHPRQCLSSAPAPPRRTPGGPGRLSTPRVEAMAPVRPSLGTGCSSSPPPKPPISRPLTLQARRAAPPLRYPEIHARSHRGRAPPRGGPPRPDETRARASSPSCGRARGAVLPDLACVRGVRQRTPGGRPVHLT